MKRIKWLTLLLVVFALFAASCGSDDDNTAGGGDDSTDTTDDDGGDDDAPADDDGGDDDAPADDDGGDDDAPADDDDADDSDEVDVTQGSDLTFYMITHSDDGPFWSVLKRGAEAAAADVGVELVWQGSNNDPAVQATDIDAAVAAGADGIAASLPSPDQLIPGLTEIIAGNGAGNRFNDLGATKILCGIQEQDNVALTERCDGLAETFNGEVVASFMGLDADQTAQEAAINAALSADTDIDGFLGVGPVIAMSGLRASDALGKNPGSDFFVGGFDITPELIDSIEGGQVAFTVDQQQYLQGYMPIILMFLEVTNANTLGGGLPILTGPGFVTPENAASVKALVEQGTR
ncbi:MAG: substrate-binding domain-containing protein [Acidimicrobiales bacterium]